MITSDAARGDDRIAAPPFGIATRDFTAGSGLLRCERVGDRTVVHTARFHSPLRVLLPRIGGPAQWAFVATFGGGLVDGDAIDLEVDVGPGASVMLGTQAGTKAYRSGRGTSQRLLGRVGAGGLLAVLPDPVTCFAGSRHTQSNTIELTGDASLVLVDTMISGRVARGERWAFLTYASRTRLTRDGAPIATDAIALDAAHGDLAARMGRFDVLTTVLAFGARALAAREALLAAHQTPDRDADVVVSSSPVGDDGVVLRVAATAIEPVSKALRGWLGPLTTELGDDPFARKW